MDSDTIRIYEERCCIGTSTIIGTREYQQDALYAAKRDGMIFAVVCDGMGGMQCGEKASRLAVETLVEDFWMERPKDDIRSFFKREVIKLDRMVAEIRTDEGEIAEAGTTIVAVIIKAGELFWLSVGDSRIYMAQKEGFRRLTRDHNYSMMLNEQLETGTITMEAYRREQEQGEALISFLGVGDLSLADLGVIQLETGSQILLCSDGLYKSLTDEQLSQILQAGHGNPEKTAGFLTACALDEARGGQDNTSVIVIEYKEE